MFFQRRGLMAREVTLRDNVAAFVAALRQTTVGAFLCSVFVFVCLETITRRKIGEHLVMKAGDKAVCYVFSAVWSTVWPTQEEISGELLLNPETFEKSYKKMMADFKVYIYEPEDIFYGRGDTFLKNLMESPFRTLDPLKAHLYIIDFPLDRLFSLAKSNEDAYERLNKYIDVFMRTSHYWVSTLGANHVFLGCHEKGVEVTKLVPMLSYPSIRFFCSSSPDYNPYRDVLIPKSIPVCWSHGGGHLEDKKILGFLSGNRSSKAAEGLFSVLGRDLIDIQAVDIGRAKFCFFTPGSSGHVSSYRIVEAIYCGCVPVIVISGAEEFPFSRILAWDKFSVISNDSNLQKIKEIVKSEKKYKELYNNLMKVQKYFRWNIQSTEQDAFHMTMFELWNRYSTLKYYYQSRL